MTLPVAHLQNEHGGVFCIDEEGTRMAEMTYRRLDGSRVLIDHTQVHPRWRGKGVARQLLDAAVEWARGSGTKLDASCSYVVAQFARDPTLRDVQG